MKRDGSIAKIDQRLYRTAYGWTAFWLGLPFVAIGTYFALAGFAVLPLAGKANAPLWVIGLVGVVFAWAGLLLVVYAVAGIRHRRRATRLRTARPDAPWLADYPWDANGIADQPARRWLRSAAMTLFLAVFMTPFHWWAFLSGVGPWMVKLMVGLFDLLLVTIAVSAVRQWYSHLRHGGNWIAFERFPFVPGEPLVVHLYPPRRHPFSATLRYVEERFETRGQRRRNPTHRAVAKHVQHLAVSPDAGRPARLAFALPDDATLVTRMTADPAITYWELLIEGDGLRTTFPLPVYAAPGQRLGTRPPDPDAARRMLDRDRGARTLAAAALGVPLLLLALAWLDRPARFGELWHAGRVALSFRLEDPGHGEEMGAALDASGNLWVLSKYALARYPAGADDGETQLDSRRYRDATGERLPAASTFIIDARGRPWIGGWRGELYAELDGRWRQLLFRDEPLRGRIRALLPHSNGLLIGGRDGLWRLAGPDAAPTRVAGLPEGPVGALAVDGAGRTVAAVGTRLLTRVADGAWRELHRGRAQILALQRIDRGWRLGTARGLVELDADGRVVEQALGNLRVTALIDIAGRAWAATWGDGLWVGDDLGWRQVRGLPAARLTGIAADNGGKLWLTFYGDGLARGPADLLHRAAH